MRRLSITCVLGPHCKGSICAQCNQEYHGVELPTTHKFLCEAAREAPCLYLGQRTGARVEPAGANLACQCATLDIFACGHPEREAAETSAPKCTLSKSKLDPRIRYCRECPLRAPVAPGPNLSSAAA